MLETLTFACPGCYREEHGCGLPDNTSSKLCDTHLLGMYRQLCQIQSRQMRAMRASIAVLTEQAKVA